MKSPSSRQLVKDETVKVVGAIYDVGTGKINWLKEAMVENILHEVETNPNRAMDAMAPSSHSATEESAPGKSAPKEEAKTTQHG